MKPKNLKYVDIDVINDYVTNVDVGDSPKSVAVEILNYRNTTQNIVAEKDYGTKHILPTLPCAKLLAAHFMVDRDTAAVYPLVIGANTTGRVDIYLYRNSVWQNLTASTESSIWAASEDMTFIFHEIYAQNKVIVIRQQEGHRHAPVVVQYDESKQLFWSTPIYSYVTPAGARSRVRGNQYIITPSSPLLTVSAGYRAGKFGLPAECATLGTEESPLTQSVVTPSSTQRMLVMGNSPETVIILGENTKFTEWFAPDSQFEMLFGSTWIIVTVWFVDSDSKMYLYPLIGSTVIIGEYKQFRYYGNGQTATVGDWLTVGARVARYDEYPALFPEKYYVKLFVTAVKSGYMESDPIAVIHADVTAQVGIPYIPIDMTVNNSKMDQRITGFRFYGAKIASTKDSGVTSVLDNYLAWSPADADMVLLAEVNLNEYAYSEAVMNGGWVAKGSGIYQATFTINYSSFKYADANTTSSIYSNLGHAIDINRSELKPKFLASAEKTQGSIIVVDQDDGVLRMSSYDGYGVHEDENFPDVMLDAVNERQKVLLTQNGKIIGLVVQLGQIYVFKRTTLEVISIGNAQTQVYPIDCIAPRSIVKTPHGIVWVGTGAIYMLPINGGPIQQLNAGWSNVYNGSLKFNDSNVAYISNSDKEKSISGYNPYYDEVWIEIQTATAPYEKEYVNYRFCLREGSRKWVKRRLELGRGASLGYVNQFITSIVDSKLYIVYDLGIIAYPNMDDETSFYDCAPYGQYDHNNGEGNPIGTKIKINIGELHSLPTNYKLYSLMLNYSAAPTKSAPHNLRVNIYGDYYDAPLDTMVIPILSGTHTEVRGIKPFGQVERLMVEIDSKDANCNKLNISRISLGILVSGRQSNV